MAVAFAIRGLLPTTPPLGARAHHSLGEPWIRDTAWTHNYASPGQRWGWRGEAGRGQAIGGVGMMQGIVDRDLEGRSAAGGVPAERGKPGHIVT